MCFFKKVLREFVLNRTRICPGNRPSLLQVTLNNVSMSHNILGIKGNAVLLEDLSKDLSLKIEFKQCKMQTNEYSKKSEYPVPGFCAFFNTKTIFGPGIGSSFTPKVSCPIKRGKYVINFKMDLKAVVSFPTDKTIHDLNLIIFDEIKKKEVSCLNTLMWMKKI